MKTPPKLEREKVVVNGLTFHMLYADGAFVRSFQYSWQCASYCILKWGALPTVKA